MSKEARARSWRPWAWLILALLWSLVLAWFLLREPQALGLPRTPSYVANLMHAVLYAPLGFLLLGALRGWFVERGAWIAWILASGHGIAMEALQSLVPGRASDPFDAVTNACGAALGIQVLRLLLGIRSPTADPGHEAVLASLSLFGALLSALCATLS